MSKERRSIYKVGDRVESLGWTLRETPIKDVGIDAIVEERDEDGDETGMFIALQVKCGESYYEKLRTGEISFRDDRGRHPEYWFGCSLPVILVLVSGDFKSIWWQEITPDTVPDKPKTKWTTKIPPCQELDASAMPRWREIARASKELEGYVKLLEAKLSAYEAEVSEFRDEFACPVCGAWRRSTYEFDEEDSSGRVHDVYRRVFSCGMIEDNNSIAQPCPRDPSFPLFEDFDIKMRSLGGRLFGFLSPRLGLSSTLRRYIKPEEGNNPQEIRAKLLQGYIRVATEGYPSP